MGGVRAVRKDRSCWRDASGSPAGKHSAVLRLRLPIVLGGYCRSPTYCALFEVKSVSGILLFLRGLWKGQKHVERRKVRKPPPSPWLTTFDLTGTPSARRTSLFSILPMPFSVYRKERESFNLVSPNIKDKSSPNQEPRKPRHAPFSSKQFPTVKHDITPLRVTCQPTIPSHPTPSHEPPLPSAHALQTRTRLAGP